MTTFYRSYLALLPCTEGRQASLHELLFQRQEAAIILVSLEHIQAQLCKILRPSKEKLAILRDLLEKQGVGPIEDGQINLLTRKQLPQLLAYLDKESQGHFIRLFKHDRNIHITVRVAGPDNGCPELQHQSNASPPSKILNLAPYFSC